MFGRYQLFDVGGTVATMGLLVALMSAVVANRRRLAKLEPCRRTA
jgi:hypothetical protein